MIGNNTLLLNESTVIEAVQEYLDKRMTAAPKVASVKPKTGNTYSCEAFEVQLKDREAESS